MQFQAEEPPCYPGRFISIAWRADDFGGSTSLVLLVGPVGRLLGLSDEVSKATAVVAWAEAHRRSGIRFSPDGSIKKPRCVGH